MALQQILPLYEAPQLRAGALFKHEIAEYFGVHLNTLANWIHHPACLRELVQKGYYRRQKQLSGRQVKIVMRFLGEID